MTLRALWHSLVGPPVVQPMFSPEVERRVLIVLTTVEANIAALIELQRMQAAQAERSTREPVRHDPNAAPRRRAPNEGFRRPPAHEPG